MTWHVTRTHVCVVCVGITFWSSQSQRQERMIKASNVFYFCSPSTLFDGLITVSVMCSLKHRDSCYTLIINLTNHCCTNFTWPGKSLWKHSCSHDVEQTFQIQKDEMKHSLCPFFIYFFVGIPEVIFSSEHFLLLLEARRQANPGQVIFFPQCFDKCQP